VRIRAARSASGSCRSPASRSALESVWYNTRLSVATRSAVVSLSPSPLSL
jgi:hypothetical protein